MNRDDLAPYIFIIFFIVVPILKGLFKHKKKNPLPRNNEDFEKKYKTKEHEKHRQHLKPVPDLQPIQEKIPRKKAEFLSRSYKPGYGLESKIKSNSLSSSIRSRHVESALETKSHKGLLQERFSEDLMDQKGKFSFAKGLTNRTKLKEAVILAEILKRRF